jgi:hypothetical protein
LFCHDFLAVLEFKNVFRSGEYLCFLVWWGELLGNGNINKLEWMICFMVQVAEDVRVEESDEEFLEVLGRKLNDNSKTLAVEMSPQEADRMLSLFNQLSGRFAIAPENFIFNVGFRVYAVDRTDTDARELNYRTLFDFRDSQFPDGYDWERVADVFMNERNLDVLRLMNVLEMPIRDRTRYEY